MRAELMARGYSIRAWSRERGLATGSVYNSLRGLRNGPRAHAIRVALRSFLHAA